MLRRKGFFTARITVPADVRDYVGRDEVWRSTLTDDHRAAKLRDTLWQGHFGSLFTQLRKNARRMAREQIDSLVTDYLNAQLDQAEERIALELNEWSHAEMEDFAGSRAFMCAAALARGDLDETLPEARTMLPGAPEPVVRILARRLLEANLKAVSAELGALAGQPIERPVMATSVRPIEPAKADGPLLSEVCREYVKVTSVSKAWTKKTHERAVAALDLLVQLVPDKPVKAITKADMNDAAVTLLRVPANCTKRYPGMSVREAVEAADEAADPARLDPQTANMRIVNWKSAFKWAVVMDHVEKSPADHIKPFPSDIAQDQQRAAFTDGELRKYFATLAQDEKHPAHRMIALAMLYAGLRLEEAAALRACDIRKEQGVDIVDVTPEAGRLKTANARRIVPLHSAIAAEVTALARRREAEAGSKANLWGFEKGNDGRLSSALSKRMNRRLKDAGVKRAGLLRFA